MLSVRARIFTVVLCAMVTVPAFAARSHRAPTSGHATARPTTRISIKKKIAATFKPRGQRGIDAERATQIQKALIRENYMTGEPSGQWDSQTEAAMQKYQADHGWQTKLMPDSRALIKLGLGPQPTSPESMPSAAEGPARGGSSFTEPQAITPGLSSTFASTHTAN